MVLSLHLQFHLIRDPAARIAMEQVCHDCCMWITPIEIAIQQLAALRTSIPYFELNPFDDRCRIYHRVGRPFVVIF